MRLNFPGRFAVLVAAAALGVGAWLAWEAVTDGLVLYLTEASSTAEGSNARTLQRLEWARDRLAVDDRVLRALAQSHLNESTRADRETHRSASVEALESAIAAAPYDARLDYALAWLYLGEHDLAAAEKAFVSALYKDPVQAEYRYGLGRLRESQGNLEAAIALYQSALDLEQLPKAAARLEYVERRHGLAAP